MKCPDCEKEGKESIMTLDNSWSTAVHVPAQFDKDGRLHVHGGNTTTSQYTCSNSHRVTKKEEPVKCWCGE